MGPKKLSNKTVQKRIMNYEKNNEFCANVSILARICLHFILLCTNESFLLAATDRFDFKISSYTVWYLKQYSLILEYSDATYWYNAFALGVWQIWDSSKLPPFCFISISWLGSGHPSMDSCYYHPSPQIVPYLVNPPRSECFWLFPFFFSLVTTNPYFPFRLTSMLSL